MSGSVRKPDFRVWQASQTQREQLLQVGRWQERPELGPSNGGCGARAGRRFKEIETANVSEVIVSSRTSMASRSQKFKTQIAPDITTISWRVPGNTKTKSERTSKLLESLRSNAWTSKSAWILLQGGPVPESTRPLPAHQPTRPPGHHQPTRPTPAHNPINSPAHNQPVSLGVGFGQVNDRTICVSLHFAAECRTKTESHA